MHFTTRSFLRYAHAVAAGRAGDPDRAVALIAEGDDLLGDHQWLRHLGRRLVAEAALADAWGDPVPWLREALAFFDGRHEERIASACRSLLRRAGVAVPRQRGGTDVPGPLAALGVTSRELEQADRHHTFRIDDSPLPVDDLVATIRVRDEGEDACSVEWGATFRAVGVPHQEAVELNRGFFQAGLDAL